MTVERVLTFHPGFSHSIKFDGPDLLTRGFRNLLVEGSEGCEGPKIHST